MTAYIFNCKGIVLAEVMANTLDEAYSILPVQHDWIGANRNNCRLVRAVHITEPLGFDALLPCY